jgi:hypothetical protein
MGKVPPVKGGRKRGRCHLCREKKNGEDATLCREEENGEDATCAGRKKMGKLPPVQGGKEWVRCHLCREEEPCTSEAQGKAKMESNY